MNAALDFVAKVAIGSLLALVVLYTIGQFDGPEPVAAPAPSATPTPDHSTGKCVDGAVKIHDRFATCPHPGHAVRVRSSSIILCVCESNGAPDPEVKTEGP